MIQHEIYMKRCLQLAKNGLPASMPNPSVGAVVVYQNKIIGEGFTSKYGGNHAEVNAINSVKNKNLLPNSTLYVSLEPCNHYGKTPPCSQLIVKHQIKNVVIGCVDSFSEVAGKGIETLKTAGCQIVLGVLEAACLQMNQRFFTFHNQKRPFIKLKWAETKDGFIAPLENKSQTAINISNPYSRQLTHQYRTEETAILVGVNTVLKDNPALNARHWHGKNPIRIVIDKKNVITDDYNINNDLSETIIFNESKHETQHNLTYIKVDFNENLIQNILLELHKKNIQSVLVEGGTKTLQLFIEANLWDAALVFQSENLLHSGVNAPVLNDNFQFINNLKIVNDSLIIYKNGFKTT